MAAAVDSLTENLESINEPLEGRYHNQNSAAELACLQENFECVNATLEEEKITKFDKKQVDKMTWFESVEKLYFQRDQDLTGKTGKKAGVVKKKVDKLAWFESVEKLYFQRDQDLAGKIAGVEKKQKASTRFSQRFLKLKDEKKQADKMTWFESVEKLYFQRDQDLTGKMAGLEKKQVDKMAGFESVEKERELYLQRVQDLTEKMDRVEKIEKASNNFSQRVWKLKDKMDEPEKKQKYILAGTSHRGLVC